MQKRTLLILAGLFSVVLYFVYGMIGWNVFVSFTDWTGAIPSYNYVGFEHYAELFQDSLFWQSFWNTIILFLTIPASVALGLLLAALLNQNIKGSRAFMVIYLLPFSFSFVVTGAVWNWMFAPQAGAVNTILRGVGLDMLASGWYTQSSTVMISVFIAMVWQFTGYCTLILTAAMRTIPQEKIEDAKEKWGVFTAYRKRVLPELKVPILTCAVVVMIFVLKAGFALIWTMTGGGPGTSSYTLPIFVVKEAFYKLHVSYGAAAANILVAMTLCVIVPYVYLTYRGEE